MKIILFIIYMFTIIFILIIIITTLLFYNFIYNLKETFEDNKTNENKDIPEFGFIITRHVNNIENNKIWISCIERIRKFYPTTLIVIIDDYSNYEYINHPPDFLNNCIVIKSEYKGAGELLPYYYYYHNKWFEKAIYIHDSVFINGIIDISNVNNVKFLWEFSSTQIHEERPYINEFLSYLNYKDELLNLFNNEDKWVGCFGVMSVIKHEYIKKIADKYNLFILLNHVNKRVHRMSMERILAILCFHDNEITKENASIYGHYFNMQGGNKYNYDTYYKDLSNGLIQPSPIKLYFGR